LAIPAEEVVGAITALRIGLDDSGGFAPHRLFATTRAKSSGVFDFSMGLFSADSAVSALIVVIQPRLGL
jgi:hypothetical protein